MKSRENARKTRLRKKQYIAALEEGLRNLSRILKHYRDIIISSMGEGAVPHHLEEALDIISSDTDDVSQRSLSFVSSRSSSFASCVSNSNSNSSSVSSPSDNSMGSITPTATAQSMSLYQAPYSSIVDHGPGAPSLLEPREHGFIVINPHLVNDPIIMCDPGFERRTGYTMRETLGQHIRFLMMVREAYMIILSLVPHTLSSYLQIFLASCIMHQ